ncbi:MAG: amino acid ABC transporter substrate-binding protein [Chlamydiales bacterium]|nr:amino acid ABC transporter substrate-binding protein [Chlamydiales bacterium]
MKRIFICLACLLVGCGSMAKSPYRIAVDPSWYPLDLMGKEANVYAFSSDILKAISKKEGIPIDRVNVSWDDTLEGLQKDLYDGVLSPLPPYNFNRAKYDFSDLYLPTGYVLVIPARSSMKQLKKMQDAEIAVQKDSEAERILDLYPSTIPRFYVSPSVALDKLAKGEYKGVIMNVIPAVSFIEDKYADQLKISGDPLNDAGLRLIAIKGKRSELIEQFNEGLKKIKRDGTFDKLVEKWNVGIAALD